MIGTTGRGAGSAYALGVTVDWPNAGIRGLLIDLDGVIYIGRDPIAGSAEFLAEARRRGLPFLLITNNSTTSPELVAERLQGMHIDVTAAEILTSAQAAVGYIRAHSAARLRVKLIGEAGLHEAAQEEGLEVVEDGDPAIDWVVAGLDRGVDYQKLTVATRAILGGARFLATNADALLPIEGGQVLPGAGTMIAAIQTATGVQPIVVGKPEPGLFEHGLTRLGGLPPASVAMIGDRLDTDMDGGRRAGLRTILVLTGVTTRSRLEAAITKPDAVVDNLAAVAQLFGWR